MRDRLRHLRFNRDELSGSLGDLGTFIPLTASLIIVCGLDAGTVLVFAGLFNILTGIIFNQPVPVQPMKAIAAVAIAQQLLPVEIAAAGFTAGMVILALGMTGTVEWAERVIPRPVVRGIQLGVGLKLASKGVSMVMGLGWAGLDSRVVALLAVALVLLGNRWKKFPSALVIFLGGILILFVGHGELLSGLTLGWRGPEFIFPQWGAWKVGMLQGALPQIPLTLLNSVIAVCALSSELYPGRGIPAKKMAVSVGLMNIGACLFGAMPACHGSGGLAAQHRFGARTGGSVVALGTAKIFLGLVFGAAAVSFMTWYPASVLGVLLVFAGLELTLPARKCADREEFFVAVATACGIIAVNTWVGFVLGLLAAFFLLGSSKSRQ
ncbi:MAG: sulfate transporter [Elusimicrobia bacterium]|nr:MAG: sulfate transporter [Elusimicrobiota bacterium]